MYKTWLYQLSTAHYSLLFLPTPSVYNKHTITETHEGTLKQATTMLKLRTGSGQCLDQRSAGAAHWIPP